MSRCVIIITLLYQLLYCLVITDFLQTRLDRVLILVLILINLLCMTKQFLEDGLFSKNNKQLSYMNSFIIVFIFQYLLSAFFYSAHSIDDSTITEYLPTILLSLPTFVVFYQITSLKQLNNNFLKIILFMFFVIGLFLFYNIYSHKVELLGDNFYKHSNNAGYYFVLLLPLVFYAFKDRKALSIIVMTVFYIIVLLAVKRGAILIYSVVYFFFIYTIFYRSKLYFKIALLISFSIIAFMLAAYFIDDIELLLFRFSLEGGSGRDIIYSSVLESFYDSSFVELLFGHGFLSVKELTFSRTGTAMMAHSDYLEILLDIGVCGLISYLGVLISLTFYIYKLPKKFSFEKKVLIACCFIWIVKALFSGFFMVKDSVILLVTIGIIVGNIERVKSRIDNYN